MRKIIDISLPLRMGMVVWPTSVGIRLDRTMRLEDGDAANVSRLDMDVHVGTHVDAPLHVLPGGDTVEQLNLDALVGPVAVRWFPLAKAVTAADLSALGLPPGTRRLLLRTSNSDLWAAGVGAFNPDFVALTVDAARWVVEQGIELIGVDYLSVQRFHDSQDTHITLLNAGTIIVEGLNLADVEPGDYELICLPLPLDSAEGAPARAVLRTLET